MKKFFLSVIFLFTTLLFAESYKISEVNYSIDGCGWQIFSRTKDYVLKLNVPVDTKKVFESKEAFDKYLADYNQRLENTRAFEIIEVTPVFPEEEQELNEVVLNVYVKDSFHLLAIPYPKYDSNRGLDLKIKLKDSNFLGSLTPMSMDLFFLLTTNDQNINGKSQSNQIGITFNYNHPFPMGKLNATWNNSDELHYEFGNSMPEWSIKSGLSLTLPLDWTALTWEFNQYYVTNLDYQTDEYNDFMYFTEEGKFSANFNLVTFQSNNSKLTYTPYIKALYNWDLDGISPLNSDLYGVRLYVGHSLSNSRINWGNDFRKGYSLTLSNDYYYNFQLLNFTPSVSLNCQYFNYWSIFDITKNDWEVFKYFGFTTRLYAFYNFSSRSEFYLPKTGTNVGAYIRGVRDGQYYQDVTLGYLCQTNSAIVLNLDFPFQVIKTNFKHQAFNFDLQFIPFLDVALIQNKYTQRTFHPKDGLYGAGMEVVVYPTKLKSMTIRASGGLDLRRVYHKLTKTQSSMIAYVSPIEISVGVGLFY